MTIEFRITTEEITVPSIANTLGVFLMPLTLSTNAKTASRIINTSDTMQHSRSVSDERVSDKNMEPPVSSPAHTSDMIKPVFAMRLGR